MKISLNVRVPANRIWDDAFVLDVVKQALALDSVTGFHRVKQSLDARSKNQVWADLNVTAFVNEPFAAFETKSFELKDVVNAQQEVLIIGAGPAGLFAALRCLELGIRPIVLERGKDVRARRRDLAMINRLGKVDPESNYCFGEGGAGTYSDGKLYTRSKKRGDINKILQLFVRFGAEEKILFESHPHIGTNKLPGIIARMRTTIEECGGSVHFEHKVTGFKIDKGNNRIVSVSCANGTSFKTEAVLLATGHSARDIFSLFHHTGLDITPKPFALGVRAEHPQAFVDASRYHGATRNHYLPPATYSLVAQVFGRGVFSFCMCPGGIIAPSATAPDEIVVNGWSPSKRNNPFANSGIVVSVSVADAVAHLASRPALLSFAKESIGSNWKESPLSMVAFQQVVERACFVAGGGNLVAPAATLSDFVEGRWSTKLPVCSYQPGVVASDLSECLPPFVFSSLVEGFKSFNKKIKGFITSEAIVVATESRTSSPVSIPRDPVSFSHPQAHNLYPCGEGPGYAGGIMSAAIDGQNAIDAIARKMGVEE